MKQKRQIIHKRPRLYTTVGLLALFMVMVGFGIIAFPATSYAAWYNPFTWGDGISAAFFTALSWAISVPFIIVQTLLTAVNGILAWFLFYLATYNNFIYNPIVDVGWVAVRDLANLGFITILLWIAFATMIPGLGGGMDYKKALPKLLLMAVLINFSRMITGILIDISQVVTLTFLKPFRDRGVEILLGMTGTFNTGAMNIINAKEGEDANLDLFFGGLINMATDTIFLAMTAVVFGIMTILFLGRLISLWILTIFSPFAFILSVVPQTQKYAKEWWGELGKNLTAAPILAFFLWLTFAINAGSTMADIPEQTGEQAVEGQAAGTVTQSNPPYMGTSKRGTMANIAKLVVTIALLMQGIKRAMESGAAGASIAKKIPAMAKKGVSRFVAGGGVAKVLRGAGAMTGKIPLVGNMYKALGKEGGVIDRYSRLASPELAKKAWDKYDKGKDEVFDDRRAKGTVGLGEDLLKRRFGVTPKGVAAGARGVTEAAQVVGGAAGRGAAITATWSQKKLGRTISDEDAKQRTERWGKKGEKVGYQLGGFPTVDTGLRKLSRVTGGALDVSESHEEEKVLKAAMIEDVKAAEGKIDKSGDSQMDVAKNTLGAKKMSDLYGGMASLEKNGGHGELAKQFAQYKTIEAERLAKKESGLSDADWKKQSPEQRQAAIKEQEKNVKPIDGVGIDGKFDASVDTFLLALQRSLTEIDKGGLGMSQTETNQAMKAHSDSLAKQGLNVSGAGWANASTGALAHTYQGPEDANDQMKLLRDLARLEGKDENVYVEENKNKNSGTFKAMEAGADIRGEGFGRAMIASNIENNKREAAKKYKTEDKMSRTASASQEFLLDEDGNVTKDSQRSLSGKLALKNATWQDAQRAQRASGSQSD
ncbi:MAG: hypothetical protein Q7R79_05175, partial [bacterium]|nr:hypothetical protein [bacterium]